MLKTALIWIAAIFLAAGSGLTALGAISKDRVPKLASSLFPKNGFATETLVAGKARDQIFENQGRFPEKIQTSQAALAEQAFVSEPIVPDAIGVIALAHTGDVRRELMRKAYALSRRRQLVTGWLIVDSGERNKIAEVLDYYDTSLRASSKAADVIIPIMAGALADQNFVQPFADLLSRDPNWAPQFWRQVVQTPDALLSASELRQIMGNTSLAKGGYQDPSLVYALIREGQFTEAQNLYTSLVSKKQSASDRTQIGNFALSSRYPPFDWQLFSTGEYGAIINRGTMNLSAIRGAGGLLARQLISLPKGVLTLEIEAATAIPDGADLYIELLCAEKSQTNNRAIKIPLSEKMTRQKIDNTQAVCPYYWINMIGRSSDDINGFDIVIKKFEINSEQI